MQAMMHQSAIHAVNTIAQSNIQDLKRCDFEWHANKDIHYIASYYQVHQTCKTPVIELPITKKECDSLDPVLIQQIQRRRLFLCLNQSNQDKQEVADIPEQEISQSIQP
jgi:hypothetical protein